jgi:hypothetical protein
MGLEKLRGFSIRLRKGADPEKYRDAIEQITDSRFKKARAQFRRVLTTRGVGIYSDTRASDNLYNSLGQIFRRATVQSSLGPRPGFVWSVGVSKDAVVPEHQAASDYYEALDNAANRRGGPSLARVVQWMRDRGMFQPSTAGLDDPVRLRNTEGKYSRTKTKLRDAANNIRFKIIKKTASRAYRSLALTRTIVNAIKEIRTTKDLYAELRAVMTPRLRP